MHRNIDRILTLFPVLAERRKQLAGTLSGGEQQMLAIGRGIASAPRLLLLDEPSMGLAPAIADLIFDRVASLHRESGVTLLLVEQRVHVKQANRKTDPMSSQAGHVGRAVSRNENSRCQGQKHHLGPNPWRE